MLVIIAGCAKPAIYHGMSEFEFNEKIRQSGAKLSRLESVENKGITINMYGVEYPNGVFVAIFLDGILGVWGEKENVKTLIKQVLDKENVTPNEFKEKVTPNELKLFGGPNRKIYLGCLSCSEFESDSVWNKNGLYGSSFGAKSIWNKHGLYGNPYSTYSPWNSQGVFPPVVVDSEGNFMGYFTVNKYNSKRVKISWIVEILDNYP